MTITEQFKDAVESYLSASGMNPTAFGTKVLKDPSFVFELRDSRAPSMTTIDRVLAWIAENPPEEQRKAS